MDHSEHKSLVWPPHCAENPRVRPEHHCVGLARTVGVVGLCACVRATSPTTAVSDEPTPTSAPWEQPERVCRTDDDPDPLAWITLSPEAYWGVQEPHQGVRVSVGHDPQLRTSMSWARALIQGSWAPTSRTDNKLRAALIHSNDGAFRIEFVPYTYTHALVAQIWFARTPAGELVADLDLTRKIPFEALQFASDLRAAVVMSSLGWPVGEEIVVHIEVADFCGDLRFEVPPAGQRAAALPHIDPDLPIESPR